MAIFMAYINIYEGGINKKIENDKKEFEEILKKI